MSCNQLSRPCCIGVKGECQLLTEAHCAAKHGYFHANATLCSQVIEQIRYIIVEVEVNNSYEVVFSFFMKHKCDKSYFIIKFACFGKLVE